MSSNINPNNIDGAYPVAGQDNNSQGFRDNFTNTKTNFQFAAEEITQLQSYAVLKAALTGTVLDNNMNGSILSNAQLQDMSLTRVALGTLSGSVGINYAAGHYQTVTTGGSISLAFTNFSAAGTLSFVTVRVSVASTAHTLTLPSAVGNGAATASVTGIEGFASNIITFAQTGTYEFQFHTDDGGNTVYLSELTRPRNNIFYSSEDLAAGAAVSLTTATSYFTTAAAETATLAAGVAGQIKTFCLNPPPPALSSVAITGTGGQFSCSTTTLEIGQQITIAGTLGGTGSITGYSNPTTYYIITTNGSTTFTLSASLGGAAITTTAGTPTGLTYTPIVGTMVITVTNAGWKTSGTGTITFNTGGAACTLQYVNAKWFCTGNNGAAFA
jgi:hypothetical protein